MTGNGVRWGILGPGKIARRFADELAQGTAGHLVAVASRTLETAQAFAGQSGEPAPRAYGSYEELLADPEIDAVYIGTVHTTHARLVTATARAGKHIICEKPLGVNHAEVMVAVEAARAAGVYLAEGFMYRFHPQVARLTQLLRDGAIGDIQHIEASFAFSADVSADHRLASPELAGGGILDVGGYPVSISRLIAGIAAGAPFADPVTLTGSGTVGRSGVDDWAAASLTFASGVTAHVSSGVRLAADNRVVVYGSGGRITVADPWLPSPTESSVILVERVGQDAELVTVEPALQYLLQADALAAHAAEGQAPQMSWADSLGNARTLDSWRAAVGVQYPFERDDANVPTVSGLPLRRGTDSPMPYGEIARVGKPVSRLILGCDNQTTLPHASAMFDDFVERGGTTFDTAWIYGGGIQERLFGRWIANRGVREDVVVIGKGAHTPFCDPEGLTRQLLESLDRLQTDYLDLYMMHRDNPAIPVSEFVDVLNEHALAGRIHSFGVSNWTIARFEEANAYAEANGKDGFAVLSNHFGLARALDVPWKGCEHVTDPESREWLERTKTTLLPWSSQARGFFARARRDDTSDAELVRCYYSDDNFERLARATSLAAELSVAPTAIALAYVMAQPFPTFALFGPRTIEETRTSIEALRVELTDEQVRWLDLRA